MVEIILHKSTDPVTQECLVDDIIELGLIVEQIVDVFPRKLTGLPVESTVG